MVFISYSSKDEESANIIYEHCNKHNVEVFIANSSINAGDTWSNVILDNLRKAKVVIYVASNNSLKSNNVQNELGGALISKKTIIPLLIDITPEQLPSWIAEYQAIDIKDISKLNYKMSQLTESIKSNKTTVGLIITSITLAILAVINYFRNKKND